MKDKVDLITEIMKSHDLAQDSEDTRSPSLALSLKKPSQKLLLKQIFGDPENEDEKNFLNFLRIKRSQ
jgi:hypothetical protein